MAGNVWECTRNQGLFTYPYNPKDGREHLDDPSAVSRVVRGGGFEGNQRNVRCAYRGCYLLVMRDGSIGFRVVVRP